MASLGGVSTGGGTCKDKTPNCASLLGKCKNPSWAEYMSNHCAKSCGKCATGSSSTGGLSIGGGTGGSTLWGGASTGGGTCQDKVINCASLSLGKCTEPSWAEYMSKNCARYCGKCR